MTDPVVRRAVMDWPASSSSSDPHMTARETGLAWSSHSGTESPHRQLGHVEREPAPGQSPDRRVESSRSAACRSRTQSPPPFPCLRRSLDDAAATRPCRPWSVPVGPQRRAGLNRPVAGVQERPVLQPHRSCRPAWPARTALSRGEPRRTTSPSPSYPRGRGASQPHRSSSTLDCQRPSYQPRETDVGPVPGSRELNLPEVPSSSNRGRAVSFPAVTIDALSRIRRRPYRGPGS